MYEDDYNIYVCYIFLLEEFIYIYIYIIIIIYEQVKS